MLTCNRPALPPSIKEVPLAVDAEEWACTAGMLTYADVCCSNAALVVDADGWVFTAGTYAGVR
jgi:hypothetical protein